MQKKKAKRVARLRALCEESIRSASFSSTCPLLCGSFLVVFLVCNQIEKVDGAKGKSQFHFY